MRFRIVVGLVLAGLVGLTGLGVLVVTDHQAARTLDDAGYVQQLTVPSPPRIG
ncbi:hypothetical protein [Micromonospora sp. NPDC007230]|uniref:hypothetical protein n=1 Tax=Micromonospora sp. NPDC007230 TaxID=3364237 RepID=UPI0036A1ACE0